ncbi:MAG: hypothetical protein Q4C61_09770 [Lachnospiraceae bacterium]|nr:hypothetical protein [Lachnospiraceae bacterium]
MYHELWTISCVLFALGFLCGAAGLFLKYYFQRNERYQGHAEARVVDIVAEPRKGLASLSEFHNRQAAVFEFYAGGRLIKVKDPADTYPCPYYLNQRIHISYDKEEPEHFYIEKKNHWKQLASGISMLGVVCIVAGCVLFLMYAARVTV